ncbi:MAG TPA: hypothetical protein VH575_15980, partial [Gemmataceae bacterium]
MPNYRRLSAADLNRLRKDDDRTTSSFVANALFNLLLLAALWGLPYYFCSLVLSKESESANPRKAIIGVWLPAAEDAHDAIGRAIEFTRDGEFRLSRGGIVELTAHYRFDEFGYIWLYHWNPPRVLDPKAADAEYRLVVIFTGDDTATFTEGVYFAVP